MDSDISPHDISTILGKQGLSYAGLASLIWLIWDVVIHFDYEVEHIWQRPRSWVSWLYICVRYAPICHGIAVFPLTLNHEDIFSSVGCRIWTIYEISFIEVLTIAVECILMMRVYILYNHSKAILTIIILCFLIEVIVMITSLCLVIPRQTFTPDCLVAHSPRIYIAYWLSSLAFETFLFILTLVQFSGTALREFRRRSIMYVFIRDGTWAFALIFVSLLLNTLMYQLSNTPIAGMGYFWCLSVLSFSGAHVLLNLRRLSACEPFPFLSVNLEESLSAELDWNL